MIFFFTTRTISHLQYLVYSSYKEMLQHTNFMFQFSYFFRPTFQEQPKRPLSAYMLWLNTARDKIYKDNPGLKRTDIARKGGEIWKAMADKSEWYEKADILKKQYERQVNGEKDMKNKQKTRDQEED